MGRQPHRPHPHQSGLCPAVDPAQRRAAGAVVCAAVHGSRLRHGGQGAVHLRHLQLRHVGGVHHPQLCHQRPAGVHVQPLFQPRLGLFHPHDLRGCGADGGVDGVPEHRGRHGRRAEGLDPDVGDLCRPLARGAGDRLLRHEGDRHGTAEDGGECALQRRHPRRAEEQVLVSGAGHDPGDRVPSGLSPDCGRLLRQVHPL